MTEERKSSIDALRIDRDDVPDSSGRAGRWLIAGLVIAVLGVVLFLWLGRASAVEVTTSAVREVASGERATVLNASGYVVARRKATVSSKVTGKVVDVRIEEGMQVDEGQLLATIDDANVRAGLALARAQRAASDTSLAETRVRVRKAELDLERARALVAERVVSQAEVDVAEAELDALRARLSRLEQEVRVASRQVALREQELSDTVIRAPFAGVVVAKNAQPGEMISPMSAGGGFTRTGIGTIVDMSSLEIEVDVNEAYINRVEPEQPVEATLDAYPDWKIACRVIAIVPTADRQKATVRVRIAFDELDPRILPDMGVKVAFRSEATEGGVRSSYAVPRSAVVDDAGREVVFVAVDGRAERRAVRSAGEDGGDLLLLSGVAGGERVIVSPPAELADGAAIEDTTSG